jgi:prevent-host-death family protein
MKTLPLSEAKSRLSGLVEQVRALDVQVMITGNGSPAAALVSVKEFERWKETIEVRGDAALMKEVRAGLRALRSRKARSYNARRIAWLNGRHTHASSARTTQGRGASNIFQEKQ